MCRVEVFQEEKEEEKRSERSRQPVRISSLRGKHGARDVILKR